MRRRTRRPARGPHAPAALLTLPLLLRKFAELSMIAAFLGAVLAFPLQVPPEWGARYSQWVQGLNGDQVPSGRLDNPFRPDPAPGDGAEIPADGLVASVFNDLDPVLTGRVPTLELKVTVWLLLAAIAIAAHMLARLYEAFFRQEVFATDLARPAPGRWPAARRFIPVLCIPLFLAWALVSISPVGWGPLPPPEAADLQKPGGWNVGGGYHSFVAWIQVAVALVFFIIAEDLFRTRRLVYKVISLVLILGFVGAGVAILVHARFPGLSAIWVKWDEESYRNDVAAFFGHNAALSSYLAASVLIGWSLLAAHRGQWSRWARAGVVAGLVVMAMALVMAQSRAVIPIFAASFIFLVVLLARRASLPPTARFWGFLAVLVMGLALSQIVSHPANPFYRRNMPLIERVQHLSARHLLTETRLRILVCSFDTMRERLFQGAGWGAFQYVYPEVQGEYYLAHPEASIAPTPKRTMRAHNEYLQTMFETGLVGLALGLTALGAILLGGRQTFIGTINQRHIALQAGLLAALTAMLLHAGADFPFRVPPLACTILLLLAIWCAGDRLWLVPAPSLDQRVSRERPQVQPAPVPGFHEAWRARPAPFVLWCGVGVVVFGVVCVGAGRSLDWFTAKTIEQVGNSFNASYRVAAGRPGAEQLLNEASRHFQMASRIAPAMGSVYYNWGVANGLRVRMLTDEADRAEQAGDAQTAARDRGLAVSSAKAALQLLDQGLSEHRFHGVYRDKAFLHYNLAQLSQDPSERLVQSNLAVDNLERAVDMNPGDPAAIFTLLAWKENARGVDPSEPARLRRLLYHFHPPYFEDRVVRAALDLWAVFERRQAHTRAKDVYDTDHDNPSFRALYALTSYYEGDSQEAVRLAASVSTDEYVYVSLLKAIIAAREGAFETARKIVRSTASPNDPYYAKRLETFALLLTARDPDSTEEEQAAARSNLARLGRESPLTLTFQAEFLHDEFNDTDAALERLRERERLASEEDPGPGHHALLAQILVNRNQPAYTLLREAQDRAREAGEPVPAVEEASMRRDLEGAAAAFEQAIATSGSSIQRAALGVRLRQVRSVLAGPG